MSKSWQLSRRTVLRGLGTAMALPLLDAMMPASALAAGKAAAAAAPKRMAFIFVPNGAIMSDFRPKTEGTDYELPPILESLAPVKDDILVFSGLAADKARANGDGAGDHARCSAAYLTASQPRKTAGKDIRVGVSVDQFAAQHVGELTPLPSLEIGTDPNQDVGNCDSGYSCAYSSNIAWRTPNTPVPKQINPRQVFERLFGDEVQRQAKLQRAKRDLYRKSILDFVAQDARRLNANLGQADRRKMDEYFGSVRQIELRIARAAQQGESDWQPDYQKPDGIPRDFKDHLHIMADLLALAFQGDVTRISTFMFARAGSNRSYRAIGVPDGHHSISHHGGNAEKIDKIRKIDTFHVEQFAYFVQKLKSIKEGDGTLLDNCMVLYGSGISDGNRHQHNELPAILAGRGGGTIRTGRHVRYDRDTPMANLFLEMLDRMNVKVDSFGDSNGRLKHLTA